MDQQELIENYLANRLSQEESEEFSKLMEGDARFREEVRFMEGVKRAAQREEDLRFKEKLREFEQEAPHTGRNSEFLWPVAATIVILLGLILYRVVQPTDPQQLYSIYFEPARNVSLPVVRGGDGERLSKAFVAYEQGHFQEALEAFDDIPSESAPQWLSYYQGSALLALGHVDEAVLKLKDHVRSQDGLATRSHWFLALAYLKSGNLQGAHDELIGLQNAHVAFKKEQAKALLSDLSELLPSP